VALRAQDYRRLTEDGMAGRQARAYRVSAVGLHINGVGRVSYPVCSLQLPLMAGSPAPREAGSFPVSC
jgi:hypothetical protein